MPITIVSIFNCAKVLAKSSSCLMRGINKVTGLGLSRYVSNSMPSLKLRALSLVEKTMERYEHSGQGWAVLSRALSPCLGLQLQGSSVPPDAGPFLPWTSCCRFAAAPSLCQLHTLKSCLHPRGSTGPSSQWICPHHPVKLGASPVKFI